ncbi:MAG: hypothetical protein FWF81_02245 [Defluviitaleaceae bacterium]|nr:hypothetical protein [Defluviitaleaceae bacterium]
MFYHYLILCSGAVQSPLPYDDIAVYLDYHALLWNRVRGVNTDPGHVTGRLNMSASGVNGTTITWTSSNPAVINESGFITRPYDDTVVTVTAVVSRGAETSNPREFVVTVPAALCKGFFHHCNEKDIEKAQL